MALSRPFKKDRLALALSKFSPPGDQQGDVLGFVPTGSVSRFSTLQIFREASTCEGCFARQSVCSVVSRAVHPHKMKSDAVLRNRLQHYWARETTDQFFSIRVQELCESRGGHHGFPVTIILSFRVLWTCRNTERESFSSSTTKLSFHIVTMKSSCRL